MNPNSLANIREGTRLAKEAAAARDAAMAPTLRELSGLSAERVAAELSRRGFGYVTYMTVRRARLRLGLAVSQTRGGRIKLSTPKNRAAAGKANPEIVAVE